MTSSPSTIAAQVPRRITPQRRQALQEQWEQGRQLLHRSRRGADRRRGLDLLVRCVAEDPGNRFYVEQLLHQAMHWTAPWWRRIQGWGERRRLRGWADSADWGLVLQRGPAALVLYPRWAPLPLQLADACRAFGLQDAERAYCRFARAMHPQRLEPLRRLAQTLMRTTEYASAAEAWREVLALLPEDPQARLACELIEDPPSPVLRRQAAAELEAAGARPERLEGLGESLRGWLDQGQLDLVERGLGLVRAASPGDMGLLELAEETLLARARRQRLAAQRWRETFPELAEPQAEEDAEANLRRVQLDVATARRARQPGNAAAGLELAVSLQQARRWRQAAEMFESLLGTPELAASCHLGLAECLQHMRRFSQALEHYRAACDAPQGLDAEARKLAMYREAVLAEAMGRYPEARARLEQLAAVDPDFRDLRSRLDKLPRMRHKD